MALFNGLNISASALTAQRLRMDVISSNIANATATRARLVDGQWVPYRRKMVEMVPAQQSFDAVFQQFVQRQEGGEQPGVKVTRIVEDQTPFRSVYDPSHPDADENGYVLMPNVDIAKEMVDLMTATRAYEANVTAFNSGKQIAVKALEIGR